MRVYLDFEGPEAERASLGVNFRVYVRIVEWRGEDVLQLPICSLFRNGEAWAVFRVEANRARLAPVLPSLFRSTLA